MYERDPLARDAENFRFSLLSSAVEPILTRRADSVLNEEDLRKLGLARDWLADVMAGARLIAKGQSSAVSPRRAVDALVYVLSTLEAMALIATEDELLDRLRGMLAAMDRCIQQKRVAADEAPLRDMAALFRGLNQSVLSDIKNRSAYRPAPAAAQLY